MVYRPETVTFPTTALILSVVMLFLSPDTAHTQQKSPADETVEEIVVTGSRIPRDGYSSPSPITTIDSLELKLAGTTNLEDSLDALPQVVPSFNRTQNNPGNGTASVDLRGLGANRTLVLLNGRRIIPSTVEGTVDLNNIPAGLIDRMEVVSGGASAVYGSDALTGAVNFILKEDFEGIEIKRHLMTDTAQGRIRDPAPASADRPVYVAEEQMADVVMTRQDLANMVAVSPQTNPVDAIQSDVKRRVVHEQVDRLIAGHRKSLAQPVTALPAITPPPLSLLDRVE